MTATWDREVDVLCVGSGAGGLAAAATAAEAGAEVLVAEKDKLAGGVTALSSGQVWLGATHLERELGIEDSVEDTLLYLEGLAGGLAVPSLREAYVHRGIETIAYLGETLGIPLAVIRGLPDYYFPKLPGSKPEGRYLEVEPIAGAELGDWAGLTRTSPFAAYYSYLTSREGIGAMTGTGEPFEDALGRHLANDERCAGAGLAAHLLKATLDRGAEVLLESPAVDLVLGDGGVEGAVLSTPGGELRVRARAGVVLATGGYDWNADFVRAFESLPEAGSQSPRAIEGDHLVLAARVGASITAAREPGQNPVFVGYQIPGDTIDGGPGYRGLLPGRPHSILVNRYGRRFCNDSFYPDVVVKVGRFDGPGDGKPNWPAWLVFDQSFLDAYGLEPVYPGQPLPDGAAATGTTVRQLAEAAGIDAAGLEETVERFNGFCESGDDLDFARGTVPWGRLMTGDLRVQPNPNLAPLVRPPFYAVELHRVVMGVGTVGLATNEVGQVVTPSDDLVPGLYAAGNSSAWRDIGGGFNSGIANARGLVFGHLAARAMAGLLTATA